MGTASTVSCRPWCGLDRDLARARRGIDRDLGFRHTGCSLGSARRAPQRPVRRASGALGIATRTRGWSGALQRHLPRDAPKARDVRVKTEDCPSSRAP